MKKFLLLFLILCMGFVLAACQSGQAESGRSAISDMPITVDGELFPPQEEMSSALDDVSGKDIAPESETEDTSSEPAASASDGRYGPKTGQYAKMMASGQYRMRFDVKFAEEDINVNTSYDMALSGTNFYMKISVDNPQNNAFLAALETITIMKDGKLYVLNPSAKTYVETTGGLMEAGAIGVNGLTFTESGKEEGLEYEEYSTADGGTLRYYMDGGQLVRFSSATEDRTLEAENIALTAEVPKSLFEIPSGYKKAG